MRLVAWMLTLAVAGSLAPNALAQVVKQGAVKGVVVDLDGLKAETPSEWIREKSMNRRHTYTFRLIAAKEDSTDAELAVIPSVPGTIDANIQTLKQNFIPPSNRTLSEVSKVTKFALANKSSVTYLDVQGTYINRDRASSSAGKADVRPDYRMLVAMIDVGEQSFQIRLIGPAKTVEQHRRPFEAWVKNFQ